ncbi:cytidine deaminase [Oceanivirga salmonicida]|uniref:cytidine deaminase n=1 Tax=Oceanivirga salmonicida TaxID=1769291 RepID=UPI0008323E89|nr:cytidine deaminase [Oceanivirga salmonicida]
MDNKKYIEKAEKLLKNAYCPYSNFPVAAIVIDELGNSYEGVNVENAAYPSSLCAERNAVTTAITNGMKNIQKVIVIANTDRPISPCGACRQVISEFSTDKTKVILATTKSDKIKEFLVSEILPYGFENKDL